MIEEPRARERFAELMASDDDEIELDRVALAIAQGEYRSLDIPVYLRRLDEMAADLKPRLSPEESPERLVVEVNSYLFGDEAFHGNVTNYHDPRNSYLNDVLDRRTGIPITLSLLYIELGRRVHLNFEGVGMPGHFLVRCPKTDQDLLIDPFNQGAVLTRTDCAERLRELYGNSLKFTPALLRPASKREIVTRLLANLKGCYLRSGDLARATRAVEWSLVANPTRLDSLREQGLLRYRQGDFRAAAADLERYLESNPEGSLARQTRAQLRHVEELWLRRN